MNEEGISKFICKMKSGNYNVQELKLKFNPSEPYALVKANGVPGIKQSDDYYTNIEDHVFATDIGWFSPICLEMGAIVETNVQVNSDGSFQRENIQLNARLGVGNNPGNKYGELYRTLKPFVLFYPYVKQVIFNGYKGRLTDIVFKMEIEKTMFIPKIIKDNNINKRILEQWLYIIDKCERDNSNNERFGNEFKLINGKINYEHKTEEISQKFHLKKDFQKKRIAF